ncbi:carboxypeptidase-like regulatory domain-containing protein [Cupriavidus taiwanensis]|nr:carboxypeptidase-like regulatory domain-containing protein [Cupriavidus taiwanensis]
METPMCRPILHVTDGSHRAASAIGQALAGARHTQAEAHARFVADSLDLDATRLPAVSLSPPSWRSGWSDAVHAMLRIGCLLAMMPLWTAALTGCAVHHDHVGVGIAAMVPNEVMYASGGNDEADTKAMLAIAGRFNVRLTIVDAVRGDPLPGTAIFLAGKSGGATLHVTEAGPMFYLQLPAGDYRLAIGYQDWLQLMDIVVDREPLDMTFRMPADEPTENWLFCSREPTHHVATSSTRPRFA